MSLQYLMWTKGAETAVERKPKNLQHFSTKGTIEQTELTTAK